MRYAVNQNFGVPYENFSCECETAEGSLCEISGICYIEEPGPLRQPGNGAHVKDFKMTLQFEGHPLEIRSIPKELRHKYEEILLNKWLESQR